MKIRHPVFALLLLAAQLANATAVLAAAIPTKPVTAAARPTALVSRAQGFYREARYDEAVGLLSGPILRKELSGDELREAHVVLARCYVKKGMLPRAKEHFAAILVADPAYVLDGKHADAEEQAVFNLVRGAQPAPPATAAGKPAGPAGKPAANPAPPVQPAQPQLHKPSIGPTTDSKPSWLSRNKYLAIAVVAGGGVVAGLALGGGGGGTTPARVPNLAGFPAPPGGH
jgi:hypothetical protein